MNTQPLISVIVPVYKVEAYLDRCVQSIVDQTYQNLEIILVDDGSPDNCPAMCDAWAAKDKRICVIHKANGGGGEARNIGLDAAKGDYIAFVDSDDYIAPWMLAHLERFITGDVDIAECAYQIVQGDKGAFSANNYEARSYSVIDAMSNHIRDTIFRQLIWNKLYRREMVETIRFPVGTSIDDEFFTYKAIGNAKRLVHSSLVCYAYRQQPGSITHNLDMRKRMQALDAKLDRHAYICEHYPELSPLSLRTIWLFCLYQGQFAQRELCMNERRPIMQELSLKMRAIGVAKGRNFMEKIWFLLAGHAFPAACWLRNRLRIGL